MFRKKQVGTADPLGGVCVYSDEQPREGIPLKLEVFLPDGTSVNCRAEVAWVDTLPDGAPARCDIGLKLTAINPQDRERLSSVLEQVRP
jgi:PilZ domain-containing protein